MKCKGMKHEINATNETNKHTTTGNRFSLAWVPSNRSFSSLLTVSGSWFSFALFFVFISFPLNYKWSEEKRVNLMKWNVNTKHKEEQKSQFKIKKRKERAFRFSSLTSFRFFSLNWVFCPWNPSHLSVLCCWICALLFCSIPFTSRFLLSLLSFSPL